MCNTDYCYVTPLTISMLKLTAVLLLSSCVLCASAPCSLPVAESLSSEQALQLLKAAASHDAQQLASQYNYYSDSEPKLVFDAYAPLGDWLTEAAAVELFRHVIHYRWDADAGSGGCCTAAAHAFLVAPASRHTA